MVNLKNGDQPLITHLLFQQQQ